MSIQFLYIKDKGLASTSSQILIILTDISSWPCALFILRALTIFKILTSIIFREESLVWK